MIEHITIRNFKSLGEVSVDLSPVTVLIGRSGVGKSNFLRAIRFLRNYLRYGEQAIGSEGGWNRIWPFGTVAPLSFEVRFSLTGFDKAFEYRITWKNPARSPNQMLVSDEEFLFGGDVLFGRSMQTWTKWPGTGEGPSLLSRPYLGTFPTLSEAVLAYTAWTSGIGCFTPSSTRIRSGTSSSRSA